MIDRKTYIGGPDAAAIVGVNPFRTPMDVFMSKNTETGVFEMNDAMRMGLALETPIALTAAEKHGHIVFKPNPEQIIHPDRAWHGGSPDFIIQDEPGFYEVKTVGRRMAHHWGDDENTDEVPPYVLVQIHWYAPLLPETTWCLVHALIAGEYREYMIHTDAELVTEIVGQCQEFWENHIVKDIPPPMDESNVDSWKRYIARKFKQNVEPMKIPAPDIAPIALRLARVKFLEAWIENETDRLENFMKLEIADADGMECPDFRVLWKKSKNTEKTDWQSVAKVMNPEAEIIKMYTTVIPGPRKFYFKWKGEEISFGDTKKLLEANDGTDTDSTE